MQIDAMLTLLDRPLLAWIADACGLLLLIGYHLSLWRVFRVDPERTHRGRSDRLRRAWVETMRDSANGILAIQTLRNWVMSATLFASTSMLIGLGVMGVAFNGVDLNDLSHALSLAPTSANLVRLKLLLIAAIFFGCFLHFALSLRYYNHTGFLINLPSTYFNESGLASTADTLNRASGHYNRGTRGFLLATPVLFWLIGPDWFLGGTLISLTLLYRFDYRVDPRQSRRNRAATAHTKDPHASPDIDTEKRNQENSIRSPETQPRTKIDVSSPSDRSM
ncbi:DUF599 domain-containing protein [Thiocystis violascens]|uniref:Putative membrane protein n=1 Tax=Thiocystis violascens (strain ATCC 17096 / DSM 198 / 6111) TaxID=765911 RepID=I3Y8H8_THIV6|nr:DUF599 domain-containing protein [Thiocystis violascens]AFL73296.1 putative membrane protein [Thiocystis violascens DSM 198]